MGIIHVIVLLVFLRCVAEKRRRCSKIVTIWPCLSFFLSFVPLENFSLIWRRHCYRGKAANFDLCSALIAIEQWGLFSVPHLLWHGSSVYNGDLRGPVTLALIAEPLAVELPLPVFYDLGLSRLGFKHPTFRLRGKRSSLLHQRGNIN